MTVLGARHKWWWAALLVALVGCTGEPAPVAEQPWELMSVDGRTVRVQVDQAGEIYDGVFAEVVDQHIDFDDEGAWTIVIHCSTGQASASAPVLAFLELAVGRLGDIQTGDRLEAESRIEIQDDQVCPVDEGDRSPEALALAEDILAAWRAAGLPVTDPRDNTGGNCGAAKCAAWLTTEEVTVVVFTDPEAATEFGGDEVIGGSIVLVRLSDAQEDLRDRYRDIARDVVG